jgi:hypothetical protein
MQFTSVRPANQLAWVLLWWRWPAVMKELCEVSSVMCVTFGLLRLVFLSENCSRYGSGNANMSRAGVSPCQRCAALTPVIMARACFLLACLLAACLLAAFPGLSASGAAEITLHQLVHD